MIKRPRFDYEHEKESLPLDTFPFATLFRAYVP